MLSICRVRVLSLDIEIGRREDLDLIGLRLTVENFQGGRRV